VKNKIFFSTPFFSFSCLIGLLYISSYSLVANATVVEVRTNVGNFQINLFDNDTPATTGNFLSYVNSGEYAANTVHRSVPGFVIQMGGFQYNNSFPPDAIATGAAVINEPVFSNLRGTIAMAKLGGDPNSATSQFFVNLANNAANLDAQNGGFTVFGQVLDNGMDVVDQIAAIDRFNFGGTFAELPLSNYTAADGANNVIPTDSNLVVITDIVVVDQAVTTNPNLTPTRNTLIDSGSGGDQTDSGSGGSVGFGMLIGLMLITARKRIANLY
jgi:peptidyl-prolyl cis-trans isomerase A (cyclophilin A)